MTDATAVRRTRRPQHASPAGCEGLDGDHPLASSLPPPFCVAAWWRLRAPAAPAAGPAGSGRRAAAKTAGLPAGRSGLRGTLRLSLPPLPVRQFCGGDGRGLLRGGSHHGGGPGSSSFFLP
jgi:hypothetical protein